MLINNKQSFKFASFSFDINRCTFSFIPDNQTYMVLRNATAMIEVNGKAYFLEQADEISTYDSTGIENEKNKLFCINFIFKQPFFSITINFEIASDGSYLLMDALITNLADETIKLDDCHLIVIDSLKQGEIPLSQHKNDTLFFKYKSWNAAVKKISSDNGIHSSDFLNLLYNPVDQSALSTSFITVGNLCTYHDLVYNSDKGIEKYHAYCKFNDFHLKPNQKTNSEKLRVELLKNPFEALEKWAHILNEKYKPHFNPKTTVGWVGCAWVDVLSEREQSVQTVIEDNALAIRERLSGFDIDYIWMSQVNLKDMLPGNWMKFNTEHFPDGFKNTLEKLKDMDFMPGLWIAPFWIFNEAEEVFEENKENFVKNRDGSLIVNEIVWEFSDLSLIPGYKHKYYILDGSKAGSLDFIERVMAAYKELGIRYYMLDFLKDSWNHRINNEPQTALQSARQLMLQVRETAGLDTHLLSAVGSSPNFINTIDAARINHDYGEGRSLYPPYHAHYNATYTVNDKYFSNINILLQNVSANYFTHRQLFINDYNLLTIDKPLPRNNAEMSATIFGLSGSPIMLGDDIRNIHPDRLALIKKCLPRTDKAAFPVDLFKNTYPDNYCRVLSLEINKPFDTFVLVAVFNLDDTTYSTTLDFAELKLDNHKSYRVYDFWEEQYVGSFNNNFACEVPPKSCKLYRLAEVRNYPWLLSTDMHIQQGNVEMDSLEWDPETMILRGSTSRPEKETGNVYLIMPKGFRLVNHEKHWLLKDSRDMSVIIRKEIYFQEPTMKWELQFDTLEYESAFGHFEP